MEHNIFSLYLAAGKSSRMGQNKLALPWKGKPLGSFGLQAAIDSALDKIFIVLNEEGPHQWINPWIQHPKAIPLYCAMAGEGQGASIRFGAEIAIRCGADALVIQLADQPFVCRELLNQLIEADRPCLIDYIGYESGGLIQPPILFVKSAIPRLLDLKGDTGARYILKGGTLKGKIMNWKNGDAFMDIDSLEDYHRLLHE
ncbi:MAG: NTP transferase domain-containing protein [Tuberibacillus sp.]